MIGSNLKRSMFSGTIFLSLVSTGLGQGDLTALQLSPASTVVGYVNGGVGWSFVPTVDILVTAIAASASQVDFWLGTNQNVGSFYFAGPYQGGHGIYDSRASTNFQTITPLLLSAGQTYYISTQQTNATDTTFTYAYSLTDSGSVYGPATFSVSPYLTQFASYLLSADGQWTSTTSPAGDNVNYVEMGPNFQFQVVPEPATCLLAGAGILMFGGWLRRQST